MQWSKWFIFWNILLYSKTIISILEIFSATCFLCILQTQLIKRKTSIPKYLKKLQHMTLMITSSNDGKSDICQFFDQDLFHIVNTEYVQNFMQNGQKFRTNMFCHDRSTDPPTTTLFFSPENSRKNQSI